MYLQAKNLTALSFAAVCTMLIASTAFGAPPAAKPAAHDHAEMGPHKGMLIELGEEEYHAEFVLDEKTHTVSVFLLDGAAKNHVAIAAKEITVTLKHDGNTESFKLKAKPQKSDSAGTASMFALADEEFVDDLHHEGSDPRLAVTIKGKPYSAKIEFDHEHGDHKHNPKAKK